MARRAPRIRQQPPGHPGPGFAQATLPSAGGLTLASEGARTPVAAQAMRQGAAAQKAVADQASSDGLPADAPPISGAAVVRRPGRAGASGDGQMIRVADLGRMMPMHAVLSAEGIVQSVGPTLARLFPGETVLGKPFLGLFDLRGPGRITDIAGLAARGLQKLHLTPRGGASNLRLRGIAMPLDGAGGFLVNLSFGIDVARAVGQLQLTDADFAPTDLAMELLYLAEANAAVRGETRELSRRLVGARMQALEEAQTDPLTGLKNRRAGDSILSRLCRERAPFSVMQIDLDFFKQVNDRLGHAAGDHVLQHVAAVLQGQSRVMDCLARMGGDEFMIILPGLTDQGRLEKVGERMIHTLGLPIPYQDERCQISASIGYAIVHAGVQADPAQVQAEADVMLYAAKEAGRSRIMGKELTASR